LIANSQAFLVVVMPSRLQRLMKYSF